MQEEAIIAQRNKIFKYLMEENENYEIYLEHSKNENERYIQEITLLKDTVAKANDALKLVQETLKGTQYDLKLAKNYRDQLKNTLSETTNQLQTTQIALQNPRENAQKVQEKNITLEEKNLILDIELKNACKRVEEERYAAEQFKQKTKEAFDAISQCQDNRRCRQRCA